MKEYERVDRKNCDLKLESIKEFVHTGKEFVHTGFDEIHKDIQENREEMKDHMKKEERFYYWFAGGLFLILSSLFGYVIAHEGSDERFQDKVITHIHELEIKMLKQPGQIADEIVKRLKDN